MGGLAAEEATMVVEAWPMRESEEDEDQDGSGSEDPGGTLPLVMVPFRSGGQGR